MAPSTHCGRLHPALEGPGPSPRHEHWSDPAQTAPCLAPAGAWSCTSALRPPPFSGARADLRAQPETPLPFYTPPPRRPAAAPGRGLHEQGLSPQLKSTRDPSHHAHLGGAPCLSAPQMTMGNSGSRPRPGVGALAALAVPGRRAGCPAVTAGPGDGADRPLQSRTRLAVLLRESWCRAGPTPRAQGLGALCPSAS